MIYIQSQSESQVRDRNLWMKFRSQLLMIIIIVFFQFTMTKISEKVSSSRNDEIIITFQTFQ